jgi:carbonic anhydrase
MITTKIKNEATQTAETQAKISPKMTIDLLKEGNKRFVENNPIQRDLKHQVMQTASGQYPFATIVSCIDSRIPTEIIFDQGIGDMFNARIAGNFVNEDILGSLEFACKLAGSKVIVVMGHTSCGAVKGACDHAQLGNLTQMLDKIMPAVDAISTPEGTDRSSANLEFVNKVAVKNVELTIENIKNKSKVLNEMLQNGEIDIVGAMYDVKTGIVTFSDLQAT